MEFDATACMIHARLIVACQHALDIRPRVEERHARYIQARAHDVATLISDPCSEPLTISRINGAQSTL